MEHVLNVVCAILSLWVMHHKIGWQAVCSSGAVTKTHMVHKTLPCSFIVSHSFRNLSSVMSKRQVCVVICVMSERQVCVVIG